jgi:hypothetical protein
MDRCEGRFARAVSAGEHGCRRATLRWPAAWQVNDRQPDRVGLAVRREPFQDDGLEVLQQTRIVDRCVPLPDSYDVSRW